VTLLEILGRQLQQALPMDDLQTLSGLESSRYRESLKSLRGAGYIAIEGDPLAEVVRLTDRGAEVSRLARPA
jgi:DNA-binding IclR family transcriptional regulator